jgi:hypothetical protein
MRCWTCSDLPWHIMPLTLRARTLRFELLKTQFVLSDPAAPVRIGMVLLGSAPWRPHCKASCHFPTSCCRPRSGVTGRLGRFPFPIDSTDQSLVACEVWAGLMFKAMVQEAPRVPWFAGGYHACLAMEHSGFLARYLLGVFLRFLGFTRSWTWRLGSTMPLFAACRLPTREIRVKFQTSWVLTQGRVGFWAAFYSANLSQPKEMADRRSLGHYSSSSPTSGISHPGS